VWLLISGSVAHAGGTVTNCTLQNFEIALIGGGTVRFACSGSITVTQVLTIRVDTQIEASGYSVTLKGGITNGEPIFRVNPGVAFGLSTVTLSGGAGTNGGAILNAGGRLNATNCTFSSNRTAGRSGIAGEDGADADAVGEEGGDGGAGMPGQGGAVCTTGEAAFHRCVFNDNEAVGGSGAVGGDGGDGDWEGGNGGDGGAAGSAWGGAVFNSGTLVLIESIFSGNSTTGGDGAAGGVSGAGIWSGRGGEGSAGGLAGGGAVYNTGTLTATGCSFDNNAVVGGGGAAGGTEDRREGNGASGGDAWGGAILNLGDARFVNCTFYADAVTGGDGGAGAVSGLFGGDGGRGGDGWGGGLHTQGKVVLEHCTFDGNGCTGGTGGAAGSSSVAGEDGADGRVLGGQLANDGGEVRLRNVVLGVSEGGDNAVGAVIDEGNSLSADQTPVLTAPGSLSGTDPMLGAYSNNGGVTSTLALLPGSPAIDRGLALAGVTTDQRGVSRPQGSAPDVGAFERQPTVISGLVIAGSAPMPGTVVLLSSLEADIETTTDSAGVFQFEGILPGTYQVRLSDVLAGLSTPAYHAFVMETTTEISTNFTFAVSLPTLTATWSTQPAQVRLVGHGVALKTYRIEAAAQLPAEAWVELGARQADSTGRFELLDSDVADREQRFYRVVYP